jgi:hypothetical protein
MPATSPLPLTDNIALKEWAVVCAALASGRQSILIRKGGIAEIDGEFRFRSLHFWLTPTRFHQSADQLVPEASDLIGHAEMSAPPAGELRLSLYATVVEARRLTRPDQLRSLAGWSVLADQTIRQRFEYREPHLDVALVRVYRLIEPHRIADRPDYAGCHSWVTLAEPHATTGLEPVLSDTEFDRLRNDWERVV